MTTEHFIAHCTLPACCQPSCNHTAGVYCSCLSQTSREALPGELSCISASLDPPPPIVNAPLQRVGGASRRPPVRTTHSLQVRLASNTLPTPPCLAACTIGFYLYWSGTSTHTWKVKHSRLHSGTQDYACRWFKAISILASWTVPRTPVEGPQFQPVY